MADSIERWVALASGCKVSTQQRTRTNLVLSHLALPASCSLMHVQTALHYFVDPSEVSVSPCSMYEGQKLCEDTSCSSHWVVG